RQSRPRTGNASDDFETLWRSAEQSASEQPEHELSLARLASKWELKKESEELWWRVAKNTSSRREALEWLRRLYRAENETAKLYDVPQRIKKSSPTKAQTTADLARLGLNIGQNTEQSHQLAKEAYDRDPNEINCAVTYAFSLSRLGRNAEGFAIIQSLPREQLHDPHAAVYVALLLAGAGQAGATSDYIAAANDAGIYPEEEKLLDEAKAMLTTASASPSPAMSGLPTEQSPTPTALPR